MISVDVIDSRRRGVIIERIDRRAIQRVGYKAVVYHGCVYRVIPNGTPRIDTNNPLRCRGEKWDKPRGRELRTACATFKREYKLSKLDGRRNAAAWALARARRVRCPWLREIRRKRRG